MIEGPLLIGHGEEQICRSETKKKAAMVDLARLPPDLLLEDLEKGEDEEAAMVGSSCRFPWMLSMAKEMTCRRSFRRVRSSDLMIASGGCHGSSLGKMEHRNLVLRRCT
ncbi:hypothetical protein ACLOJK_024360 [Asimina triloba]